MRKIILILISIIFTVCAILIIISSRADYAAEKLFYRAVKINKEIALNPDVAPPKMLERVEGNLQKIMQKYPQSKMAKPAHLALTEFYLQQKKYEQALSSLDELAAKYKEDISILSKAQFLKGSIYEKKNQWDKALKEYTILRDKYTDTLLGLGVPLYIGNYYKQNKRYTEAQQAYQEAVIFYQTKKIENRGSASGYAAANLLIQAHMELNQYEQAGEAVEDIIDNYPILMAMVQQLPNIDSIFLKTLNKPEKAIEIYSKIKAKTDDNQLKSLLEQRIKALEGD